MSELRIRPVDSNHVEAWRHPLKREKPFEPILVGRAKRASSKDQWLVGALVNGKMTVVGAIEPYIPENTARHLVFAMLQAVC